MFMTFQGKIILGTTYLNLGTFVSEIKHLKTCQLEAYFSQHHSFNWRVFISYTMPHFHRPNLTILSTVAADGAPG